MCNKNIKESVRICLSVLRCALLCRCDGQGRVIGGLGALPGFGWWPIKAYRPCEALNQAGIEYVR